MKTKLGILGGGQLARMMLPHCLAWNVPVSVLDKQDCVCQSFCQDVRDGNFQSSEDVYNLFQDRDVVTMDLEAVSLEGLKKLEAKGVIVAPSSRVIELIQNKGRQKEFFKQNDIPTMAFEIIKEVDSSLKPGFLKLLEGGYDGKGVFHYKGDFDSLPDSFKKNILWEQPCDVEEEYSLLVARNGAGEIKCYDTTEMVFDPALNLIAYTLYPARISPEMNAKAKEMAAKVVTEMNAVGVFAVEMFKDKKGNLLVNECAPRPHNSGHHTIESCETSQFENHLRGVLGLPLGSTKRKSFALTFNLIGEGSGEAHWEGVEALMATEGTYLHDYGKADCKPGRKMGHVTLTGNSYDELLQKHQDLVTKVKVLGK